MGLFSIGKKKKNDESNQEIIIKSEQIIFEILKSDDDRYICSLADQMISGQPLILNFELLDIDQANKVMAFFSGVVYALSGEIDNIQEKVFIVATKDVYDDGSMEEFLKDFVE